MGTPHWLSVVCLFVWLSVGVNDWINTSGDSLDTCHNHQSLIPPGANCDLLFCSVLISFHAANHSGLPALFSVCTAGDLSTFLYKPCMACFLFFKTCCFLSFIFLSKHVFNLFVCMFNKYEFVVFLLLRFVLSINQSIYNVLCVCTNIYGYCCITCEIFIITLCLLNDSIDPLIDWVPVQFMHYWRPGSLIH